MSSAVDTFETFMLAAVSELLFQRRVYDVKRFARERVLGTEVHMIRSRRVRAYIEASVEAIRPALRDGTLDAIYLCVYADADALQAQQPFERHCFRFRRKSVRFYTPKQ